MNNTLIYVGGYGRSGSTLLDTYLSSSENVFGLGECVNFLEATFGAERCECGESLNDCGFWSSFFSRYSDEELRKHKNITTYSDAIFQKRIDKESYVSFWRELFLYTRCSSVNVIVDSSKTTRETFFRPINLRELGERVIFIYLYKDPSNLIGSIKKGSNKFLAGNGDGQYNTAFLLRSFLGWFVANLGAVYSVWRLGKGNSLVVNYRDFACHPETVNSGLSSLGVDLPAQNTLTGGHGISGNRSRSLGGGIEYREHDASGFSVMEKAVVVVMRCLLSVFLLIAKPKTSDVGGKYE